MKRILSSATVVSSCVLAILTLTACQPAPGPTQPAAGNVNAQPEKPVDTAAIEKELLQLEREWANAYVARNVEAVKRIQADDITVTYPDGTTGTKADDVRDVETGALSAEGWELADLKVRVLDADTAVVTGRGIIKNGKYKAPDGRTQALKPHYRFTDVFERRNGQWQVISSQSTTIVNPPTTQASPSPTISPSPAR